MWPRQLCVTGERLRQRTRNQASATVGERERRAQPTARISGSEGGRGGPEWQQRLVWLLAE